MNNDMTLTYYEVLSELRLNQRDRGTRGCNSSQLPCGHGIMVYAGPKDTQNGTVWASISQPDHAHRVLNWRPACLRLPGVGLDADQRLVTALPRAPDGLCIT